MIFLIGFCIGGVVGCDSPKTNTNIPPPIQPKKTKKIQVNLRGV